MHSTIMSGKSIGVSGKLNVTLIGAGKYTLLKL